jgi:undecaprenyl-diphosphatase
VNIFDTGVMNFVNQLSQHSLIFDNLVVFLAGNKLLKGGVLVAVLWWGWFESDERLTHNRIHIVASLLSCIVAMALARALALTLPFRLRPFHEEGLTFLLPYGMQPILEGWSSFPSDHATLFFSLSTGLLFISRKAGIFALSYTLILIALPRIYLGLHYPTDIIAGAIIGMTITLLGNIYLVKSASLQSITNGLLSRSRVFYPLFFLITYQIVDLFDCSRAIGNALLRLLKYVLA